MRVLFFWGAWSFNTANYVLLVGMEELDRRESFKYDRPNTGNGSWSEIMRCIQIGLLRIQENEAYQPTVASVVQMLNRDSSSLPTPAWPAFHIYSDIELDLPSLESTSGASKSKQSRDRDWTIYFFVQWNFSSLLYPK